MSPSLSCLHYAKLSLYWANLFGTTRRTNSYITCQGSLPHQTVNNWSIWHALSMIVPLETTLIPWWQLNDAHTRYFGCLWCAFNKINVQPARSLSDKSPLFVMKLIRHGPSVVSNVETISKFTKSLITTEHGMVILTAYFWSCKGCLYVLLVWSTGDMVVWCSLQCDGFMQNANTQI